MSKCSVICASPDYDIEVIKKEVNNNDYVICADGGLDTALKSGIYPNLVIGDLDSVCREIPNGIEKIVLPVCKDETDTMYAVKEGIKRGCTRFKILCGTGGRLDHFMANLNVLSYLAENNFENMMVDKSNKIFAAKNGSFRINGKKNSIVSVFPFNYDKCKITYDGLGYTMDNDYLFSSSTRGISNFMSSDEANIVIHKGLAIIVLDNNSDINKIN